MRCPQCQHEIHTQVDEPGQEWHGPGHCHQAFLCTSCAPNNRQNHIKISNPREGSGHKGNMDVSLGKRVEQHGARRQEDRWDGNKLYPHPGVKYQTTIPLMVWFVYDVDVFGGALVGGDDGLSENDWCQFKNYFNDFGILTWDVGNKSKSIDFTDLTIEIKDGAFITHYLDASKVNQYDIPIPHTKFSSSTMYDDS